VLAVDVNRTAVEETCSILQDEGHQGEPFITDVTDAGQVDRLVRHCVSTHGRIDILHNNVGIVEVGGLRGGGLEARYITGAQLVVDGGLSCKVV
jgi:NAD(P)-dependent dehydrogenase (short-subunit alcohol dehydrogenase family)